MSGMSCPRHTLAGVSSVAAGDRVLNGRHGSWKRCDARRFRGASQMLERDAHKQLWYADNDDQGDRRSMSQCSSLLDPGPGALLVLKGTA